MDEFSAHGGAIRNGRLLSSVSIHPSRRLARSHFPVLNAAVVLLGLLAIPECQVFLYWTPTESYLRAAGEDGLAARSAGIRVGRTKTLAVDISGLLSGLAGAQRAMDRLQLFLPDMTAGRGFIGLAATLFGGGLP